MGSDIIRELSAFKQKARNEFLYSLFKLFISLYNITTC